MGLQVRLISPQYFHLYCQLSICKLGEVLRGQDTGHHSTNKMDMQLSMKNIKHIPMHHQEQPFLPLIVFVLLLQVECLTLDMAQ